ncbi:MAG: methyl-accepting chemotaxis protein [Spirochaetaceae bacterium]|jgi:methyl-accepting chemotaxis protein|nr:methyl-accepting chemotaxis protein [Spirochaetaceae bacterium]
MKFFKNMSIGFRFFMASLLITGVLFAIGWQSVGTIIECHHACMTLLGGAYETKSLAQNAQASFHRLTEKAGYSLVYAQLGDRAKSEETERQFVLDAQAMSAELDTVLRALNADPQVDKSLIAPLAAKADAAKKRLTDEYVPLIQRLSGTDGIITQGSTEMGIEGDRARMRDEFDRSVRSAEQIGQNIDEIGKGISDAGDGVFQSYVVHLESMILQHQIFLIIGVVVSLLLVLILALFIQKPFKAMMKVLGEIEAGSDLTKRFAVTGRNEIGKLSAFCNQTFEKFRNVLLEIRDESNTLGRTGESLASNTNQTAAAITQMTGSINSVKDQVGIQGGEVDNATAAMERILGRVDDLNKNIEEQTSSVNQSSAAIEQMFANIRSVGDTLVKNQASVRSLTEASASGRQDAEAVARDIQEIAKESEGLLEINAVIQNIASQTNLLSMNAAIEAAHAGEVGKGFAVVADEIRKLAENSSEQSKTIGAILRKIEVSIATINKSTGIMTKGFDTIEAGVKTVADQESAILTAMKEQESGSKQILDEVEKLKSITGLVRDSSAAISDEGKSISQQSVVLEKTTRAIQNAIQEISTGATQITVAVNQVNEICVVNKESITTLIGGISTFKVK